MTFTSVGLLEQTFGSFCIDTYGSFDLLYLTPMSGKYFLVGFSMEKCGTIWKIGLFLPTGYGQNGGYNAEGFAAGFESYGEPLLINS